MKPSAGPAACHNKCQTQETGAGVKRFIQVLPPEKTGHSQPKANLTIFGQASKFYGLQVKEREPGRRRMFRVCRVCGQHRMSPLGLGVYVNSITSKVKHSLFSEHEIYTMKV